ncbi:MAG: PH domain-containing protein [Promicromonosporaceae bacterium]|nr:PH domain-containing protein [Promicromonosporaceae bacterium]
MSLDVTETTGVAPAQAPGDATLRWHRMHPVTPLVRGWTALLMVVVFAVWQGADTLGEDGPDLGEHLGVIGLIFLGLAVLIFAGMWLSWRFMAYAISLDEVHLRRGVVFKQQRHARLDRIQAVDLRSPLVARLFGLSELRVESAGGADSAIIIGFLRNAEAQALRADLLQRAAIKSGRAAAPEASAETAPAGQPAAGLPPTPQPEQEMYAVEPRTLFGSLLRSPVMWVAAGLVVAVLVLVIVLREPALLISLGPIALAAVSLLWSRFASEFNFKAAHSPAGIHVTRGLLETRSQTLPAGRVQAVSLTQPLLWRRKDWWRVRVNVAGYSVGSTNTTGSEQAAAQSVLLPVGPRAQALTAMWLVLPELGVENPLEVLDEGLTGIQPRSGITPPTRPSGAPTRFTNAPKRAWIVDPLAWRRDAYAVTDTALLLRRGRIIRRLDVVPHAKMQSVSLQQGPLQRRLRVATFCVHSTAGVVVPTVPHLDQHDAARLLDEQAARSLAARTSEAA